MNSPAVPITDTYSVVAPDRRRWSYTLVFSVIGTAVTAGFVVGMVALFAWQTLPVLSHSGLGYVTSNNWHYRQQMFGALSMIVGTLLVSAVALCVAAPVGIGAAIITSEFLPGRARLMVKIVIELLAGIPSVVYGLVGILYLRTFVYDTFESFDLHSGDTILTAGLLLAVMILPTVMTLSDDALRAVPALQRQAARGLGLSRLSAVMHVALPQARIGVIAAVLLALGRALGEAIAVFLVVGRQDNNLPTQPFTLRPLLESGQTLASKLGGAEINIAYGDPLHWAAVVGLGLMLLVMVGTVTLLAAALTSPKSAASPPQPVENAPKHARPTKTHSTKGTSDALLTARLAQEPAVTRLPKRRKWLERFSIGSFAACTLLATGVMLAMILAIFYRGSSALSLRFFTEQIKLVGADGGIFFNIIGTLLLITTALCVCTPIAVAVALMQSVYLRERAARGLGMVLYLLNGTPSILFGLFGLVVFVKFLGWGKSWLAGGILLGLMMIPIVTVALVERMKALPKKYIEAARGLGLSKSQTVWSVIIPQSRAGLVTGSLLGLARAAGETAPIMFTATIFAGAMFPRGIVESPVLSLPYHIFILAQDSFDPRVGEKLWGTAAALLMIVMLLSLIALPVRLRIHEEAVSA
ncbi:MAG TPA: phosphate ABC transporter permease subunit PstC [Tepidisphaeraceae bacterium]|nr:phosphate ABC transporter permease subunit PstC [Tepidisphaeraceae bacterium]